MKYIILPIYLIIQSFLVLLIHSIVAIWEWKYPLYTGSYNGKLITFLNIFEYFKFKMRKIYGDKN